MSSELNELSGSAEKRGSQHREANYEDQNQVCELLRFLWEHFEVSEKWTELKCFRARHPLGSVFLLSLVGMCSVPLVTFLMFAIGSLVFTFVTFLAVEGNKQSIDYYIYVYLMYIFQLGRLHDSYKSLCCCT